MARFENTPGLFGAECGTKTHGDFVCGICQTRYFEGADAAQDYDNEGVMEATFAGLDICGNCFERVESAVLGRMPAILSWYKRLLTARRAKLEQDEAALATAVRP